MKTFGSIKLRRLFYFHFQMFDRFIVNRNKFHQIKYFNTYAMRDAWIGQTNTDTQAQHSVLNTSKMTVKRWYLY